MADCFWNKKRNEYVLVYDIAYDKNGYPLFLIYEDGQWQRVSAKHFKPTWDCEGEAT